MMRLFCDLRLLGFRIRTKPLALKRRKRKAVSQFFLLSRHFDSSHHISLCLLLETAIMKLFLSSAFFFSLVEGTYRSEIKVRFLDW